MSLRNFETKWKTNLTSILEQLSQPEFRKLMSDLDKIPQVRKAEKPREEMPDVIIQVYGTEGSISVMDKEMKVLQRMDARVQEPLKRSVEELKKRRQKIKEAAKKPAAESASVAKKSKPAAESASVAKKSKPAAESASVAKKPKLAAGTSSKPASASAAKEPKLAVATSSKPPSSASVAKKPKPAAGLKSCQPVKMDPVGAVKTKQKTESTKSTKSTKMDPVGAKKP
ncbi:uncharacterized protein LOC116398075 [Anarrhichthys ocellatus]|uniref:uncharacterized protein LOC116398075 n=1 Tax=Anarrhichthys ocellatus TaxID=433405 RepID=UPI0012EE6B64|nr:uncharacterized protein LOC116398075 [Anarrhichthys ocellatus]